MLCYKHIAIVQIHQNFYYCFFAVMQIYTVGYFKVQLNLGILHSVISSYQSSSLNISHDIDMTDVMAQHSSSLSCPAQIGLLLNIQSDLPTVSPPFRIQLLTWLMRHTQCSAGRTYDQRWQRKWMANKSKVNKLKL